jgi:hypothetical protein
VVVLTAWHWTQWLRLAAGVLMRRDTDQLTHLACRELLVQAGRARSWEVDGEVMG